MLEYQQITNGVVSQIPFPVYRAALIQCKFSDGTPVVLLVFTPRNDFHTNPKAAWSELWRPCNSGPRESPAPYLDPGAPRRRSGQHLERGAFLGASSQSKAARMATQTAPELPDPTASTGARLPGTAPPFHTGPPSSPPARLCRSRPGTRCPDAPVCPQPGSRLDRKPSAGQGHALPPASSLSVGARSRLQHHRHLYLEPAISPVLRQPAQRCLRALYSCRQALGPTPPPRPAHCPPSLGALCCLFSLLPPGPVLLASGAGAQVWPSPLARPRSTSSRQTRSPLTSLQKNPSFIVQTPPHPHQAAATVRASRTPALTAGTPESALPRTAGSAPATRGTLPPTELPAGWPTLRTPRCSDSVLPGPLLACPALPSAGGEVRGPER